MRAKQVFEFTRGDNPLSTLGIGYKATIYKFFDDLKVSRFRYTVENKQIIFKDNLDLFGIKQLIQLPDNLEIIGHLCLGNCFNLEKLPNNLKVRDYIDLRSCTKIIEIPNDLIINYDIDLAGCTNLKKLPDNLTVGGALILNACTSLTELPDNLTVGGNLFLYGCTGLTELPNNLKVGGFIYINMVDPKQNKLKNWIESSKFKLY